MNDEDDFEIFEEEAGEDWNAIDQDIQPRPSVRAHRRRDWRDVERFREDREMRKILNAQSWFDELDQPERIR